jgi:hypothetical protein
MPASKLAAAVANFITHSIHIAEHSHAYDGNASFRASLESCKNFLKWLRSCQGSYPTKSLCRQILENSGHLQNILPNPSNKSFKNSMLTINNIIDNAKIKIQSIN